MNNLEKLREKAAEKGITLPNVNDSNFIKFGIFSIFSQSYDEDRNTYCIIEDSKEQLDFIELEDTIKIISGK